MKYVLRNLTSLPVMNPSNNLDLYADNNLKLTTFLGKARLFSTYKEAEKICNTINTPEQYEIIRVTDKQLSETRTIKAL